MRCARLGLVGIAFGCGGEARPPASPAAAAPDERAEAGAPPEPGAAAHVASGDFHTCALRSDGTVRCWGRNREGQLGDGTTEMRTAPVAVVGLNEAVALGLGANSSCALLRDRTVRCWGAGKAWGDGMARSNVPPTEVQGVRDAVQLEAGGLLACAVLASGKIICWGDEAGVKPSRGASADLEGIEVSAAQVHACARGRGDGAVRCWGDSWWGGAGATSLAAPRLSNTAHVTTGAWMACALLSGGTVKCWGRNDQGELGRTPDNDWHPEPVSVAIEGATSVVAGEAHVCAIVRDGRVICWGSNVDGELGHGTQGAPEGPGEVVGVGGAIELALGTNHACALLRDGSLWCWGSNAQGQLGDGTTDRRTRPARVLW